MNISFKFLFFVLISLTIYNDSMAQISFFQKDNPFAHTYSIVAKDSITGDLGVAVQSHWFSVGTIVNWAEAGVGAIATQSFVNPEFGPSGLKLLKEGKSAKEALDILIASDDGRDVRQLAIVDMDGTVAAYTGKSCIKDAGHIEGNGFAVQANMMLNDKVWPAMSKAYENSEGSLAERMLAALAAAENEGGDIRGKQSAVLLVVAAEPTGKPWIDRKVDLRVDDHPSPIKEIQRLYKVHRAYKHMNQGDVDVEHGDLKSALDNYSKAEELYSENVEMSYWTGITLIGNGDIKAAMPFLKKAFDKSDNWKELTRRIAGTDLLPIDSKTLDKILR